jgi:malate synthase
MANTINIEGIEVSGFVTADFSQILTAEALSFVGGLAREFESRRKELLERRMAVQAEIDNGKMPDFLPETKKNSRKRMENRSRTQGSSRSPRRNHRPGRSQDGY